MRNAKQVIGASRWHFGSQILRTSRSLPPDRPLRDVGALARCIAGRFVLWDKSAIARVVALLLVLALLVK